MGNVVVVAGNFAFADNIAGVKFVFVDYFDFVDGVVAVFYDVLMTHNSLGRWTSKYLTFYGCA